MCAERIEEGNSVYYRLSVDEFITVSVECGKTVVGKPNILGSVWFEEGEFVLAVGLESDEDECVQKVLAGEGYLAW